MTARPEDYAPALDHAVAHTLAWLSSLPDRPVRPRADPRRRAGQPSSGARCRNWAPPTPLEVVDQPSRQAEPGLMANAVGALLRLGHRRHPARRRSPRTGWSAPGTRTPPCATPPRPSPRSRRPPPPGCSTCWACPSTPTSGSSPARPWPTSPPGGSPPAGARRRRLGRHPAAYRAHRGSTSWPAERHETLRPGATPPRPRPADPGPPDTQGRIRPEALAEGLAPRRRGLTVGAPGGGQLHSRAYDPLPPASAARPGARRLGARRRGVRPLGGGQPPAAAPPRPARGRGLLGHRCRQDPERPVRLRRRDRASRRPAGRGGPTPATDRATAGPATRSDSCRAVPPRPRRAGVGGAALARPRRRRRAGRAPGGRPRRRRRHGERSRASVGNDVVFTQVCATFGDDERTREVTARLLADGTAWMSGSRSQGRAVLRPR